MLHLIQISPFKHSMLSHGFDQLVAVRSRILRPDELPRSQTRAMRKHRAQHQRRRTTNVIAGSGTDSQHVLRLPTCITGQLPSRTFRVQKLVGMNYLEKSNNGSAQAKPSKPVRRIRLYLKAVFLLSPDYRMPGGIRTTPLFLMHLSILQALYAFS